MNPYRIKHKPTGLYYKPSTGNNLSKIGKIYTTANSVLSQHKRDSFLIITVLKNSTLDKTVGRLSDNFTWNIYDKIFYKVPKEEFEIEWITQ
jgi:hypothetical protein